MRRIRYAVAASLDAYIAGPNGEADWVITDPAIDFNSFYQQFDTVLLGRRTFESMGGKDKVGLPGMETLVFSRTLQQRDFRKVTIVGDQQEARLRDLLKKPGKDIWLFGGGSLFNSLLNAGLVDTVELAIVPVLLGGGIPLLPTPAPQTKLELTGHLFYGTGVVSLQYAIVKKSPKTSSARKRAASKK